MRSSVRALQKLERTPASSPQNLCPRLEPHSLVRTPLML